MTTTTTTFMTGDEAVHAHTQSLVNVAQTLPAMSTRSLETILTGHRTRHPLTPSQRAAVLEHRQLLNTINACGHNGLCTDNLAGFLSAYHQDPHILQYLAA